MRQEFIPFGPQAPVAAQLSDFLPKYPWAKQLVVSQDGYYLYDFAPTQVLNSTVPLAQKRGA